jgi:hypothetical protein
MTLPVALPDLCPEASARARRAAPASDLVDRNVSDLVPASTVDALDSDAGVALQRAPLRLVLLPEAEPRGRQLNLPCCWTDVEDFIVAARHLLAEPLRDS